MSNTRLVVVIRRDLKLEEISPGLLAAQVAHMADAFMREKITEVVTDSVMTGENDTPHFPSFSKEELSWMSNPYLSVLAVNCSEELTIIHNKAHENNLPINVWRDVVPSHIFEGQSIEVTVGLSIGPADFDKIKLVTGVLPAY